MNSVISYTSLVCHTYAKLSSSGVGWGRGGFVSLHVLVSLRAGFQDRLAGGRACRAYSVAQDCVCVFDCGKCRLDLEAACKGKLRCKGGCCTN